MKQIEILTSKEKSMDEMTDLGNQIIELSEEMKSYLIESETGYKRLESDFESKQAWLGETFSEEYFGEGAQGQSKLVSLHQLIAEYNKAGQPDPHFIPAPSSKLI